ncbi:hypothetical protein LL06_06615 [Hoeflea sp. BAL378]|nr:hypothetical protein LL06_06615 [Hoeflea sp. BAL378]
MLSVPALVLLMSGPAVSEEPIANRFTMEKTENGFVRLDTLTGEMSICTEKAGQLVCRLSADDRRAFEESLSDLSARVTELESRLDLMDPPSAIAKAPDEAELDQALDAMEKMMRRFFGMVEELQKDFEEQPKVPPEPIPDRT